MSIKSPKITLGIKDWFQYAKDHKLLLTVEDFHRISRRHTLLQKRNNNKTKPVLVVYGIDQDLLNIDIEHPDYSSISPLKFFQYREFWIDMGICMRKKYADGSKVWDCKLSSITDGMPNVLTENDYRVQFEYDPKDGSFGYL